MLYLEKIIVSWGFAGLFWAGFLEEVLAPIPSTFVMMGGGFFVLGGSEVTLLSFLKLFLQVVIPVSLGLSLGSAVVFFIFYFLGEPALNHFGKYFGVSFADINEMKKKMSKSVSDEIFIFGARAIPFFPIALVNIFGGLIRYSPVRFFSISFLGILVRATLMGFLGWQLGALHKDVALQFQSIEDFLTIVTIVMVLAAVFYFLRRHIKKRIKTPPVN